MLWRLSLFLLAGSLAPAQIPVPSDWGGEATGTIRGQNFTVPVTVEFREPLPFETNAFHLCVGSRDVKSIGDFMLTSAMNFGTDAPNYVFTRDPDSNKPGMYKRVGRSRRPSGRTATLQYFNITQQGSDIVATLVDTHAASAAAGNTFTGPNVSALEASPVMREVMRSMGPTELFSFLKGVVIRMRVAGGALTGTVEGTGRSITNTSSDVRYTCRFQAQRRN